MYVSLCNFYYKAPHPFPLISLLCYRSIYSICIVGRSLYPKHTNPCNTSRLKGAISLLVFNKSLSSQAFSSGVDGFSQHCPNLSMSKVKQSINQSIKRNRKKVYSKRILISTVTQLVLKRLFSPIMSPPFKLS